jgi:hypothetical protein
LLFQYKIFEINLPLLALLHVYLFYQLIKKNCLSRIICCFFAKHTALRRKSKDWLAQIMCLSGATCLSVDYCFFDPALCINLTKRVGLVQSQTSFSSHHRYRLYYIMLTLYRVHLALWMLESNATVMIMTSWDNKVIPWF